MPTTIEREHEARPRARDDSGNGNGGAFAGLPKWARLVFALGFPTVAAAALGGVVLKDHYDLKNEVLAQVRESNQRTQAVERRMDEAKAEMHAFVVRTTSRDEAVVQLLFRVCLQNARNSETDREACYDALSGRNRGEP